MKKDPSLIISPLPLFRKNQVQQILSWVLLLCFSPLATGCNYYRLKEEASVEAEKISGLPNLKRFILHQGEKVWELRNLNVQENSLEGKLETIPEDLLPYTTPKSGSPNRYKHKNKITALNIVHLYVQEFAQSQEGQVIIPLTSLKRMDITDRDNGATVASHVFGGIGALAAAYTIMTIIVLLTKSSCPFVYAANSDGYHFVGEAYGGAIFSPLERDDYMPLPRLENAGNTVKVKITNELKERQYTNLAELQVVHHSGQVQVLLDQTGKPHTIHKMEAPSLALTPDGGNQSKTLTSQDSSVWSFNQPGSSVNSLELQFTKPLGTKAGKLVLHAQNSLWLDYLFGEFTKQFGSLYNRWAEGQKDVPANELYQWQKDQGIPLLVEVKTIKGWKEVERLAPVGPLAARQMVIPIDLTGVEGTSVSVRLSCGFMFWEIDQAAMDFTPNLPVSLHTVKPATAFTSSGQNVKSQLAEPDTHYLQQFTVGDAVELAYQLPSLKTGQTQTLFFHTRGYYEHIREYSGIPNLLTLRAFEKPGHFMQFSRKRYLQLAQDNQFSHLLTAHATSR